MHSNEVVHLILLLRVRWSKQVVLLPDSDLEGGGGEKRRPPFFLLLLLSPPSEAGKLHLYECRAT